MFKKIIINLVVFSLFLSLFGNVTFAQEDTYIVKDNLNVQVQEELENTLGMEGVDNLDTEVLYNIDKDEIIVEIENTVNTTAPLQTEMKIDSERQLEIKVNYFDDNNTEVEAVYEVLPISYSQDEFVAEIIDKDTGEKYLIDSSEMNAAVVPIIIAHIIRVGVTAAIGIVGRALIKSAVKKLTFRTTKLLDEHFQKHVINQKEFGSITKNQYLQRAQDIIGSESSLSKKRTDGARVFYKKSTNEFVVLSKDGFIQTLFKPTKGIDYYYGQK